MECADPWEIFPSVCSPPVILDAFAASATGTGLAEYRRMGVKRLEDLNAFRLAVEFKRGVYGVARQSAEASADLRYRSQLFDSASSVEANIAEGWRRFKAGDMARCLRIALASLEEARRWLLDGIDRGYFTDAACSDVLVLSNRCGAALMALIKALQPFSRPKPRR